MRPRFIGLSVSFCIKDIIEGKVHANDVDYIIGGTKAESQADWRKVAESYSKTYWKANPLAAVAILEGFLWQNKIQQPRVNGHPAKSICLGHWIVSRFEKE